MTPWLTIRQLATATLLALLLANAVAAAPAATYGREFVRLDRYWPDEAPVALLPKPPRQGQAAAVAGAACPADQ